MHLFRQCMKTKMFWQNLATWLQSCHILPTDNRLHMETILGLKPDSSNFKLQINSLLPNGLTLYLDMSIKRALSNSKQLLDSSETYTSLRKHVTNPHKKWTAFLS